MWRELIVPFQRSGFGIQRQDAFGEEVIAGPVAIVGIGIRSGRGPEQRVGFRIVAARQPGGSAPEFRVLAFPGFVAWLSLGRYGPESPRAFARGRFVSGQESANA